MDVPSSLDELAGELFAIDDVERVVLGGSRAIGTATESSDWDLGVHYRGSPDFSPIARRGELHGPGSWGRLMNGGAWLDIDGRSVDVVLRDLDVVDHWWAEAGHGRYEVDGLLGYIAGIPTYSLVAELDIAVVLHGPPIAPTPFPEPLAESGHRRWLLHEEFSLTYAAGLDQQGRAELAAAHRTRAHIEAAHAAACAEQRWVLNEKHLF